MAEMDNLMGLSEALQRMQQVKAQLAKKSARTALRKAANQVKNRVKANASRIDDPSTASSIARNVAVRWDGRRSRAAGELVYRVGILGGARKGSRLKQGRGGDTYYWRFVEFGTSRQRARPFFRPAILESEGRVGESFRRFLLQELDKLEALK